MDVLVLFSWCTSQVPAEFTLRGRTAVSRGMYIFSFTRQWWIVFWGLTNNAGVPILPHVLHHFVLSQFLSFANLYKMVVYWEFNFCFWTLLNIFYICLSVIQIVKYLFTSFVQFPIGLFAFFWLFLVLHISYMYCKYPFPISYLSFYMLNAFWWPKVFHFTFPLWVLFVFCLWNSSPNQNLRTLFLLKKKKLFSSHQGEVCFPCFIWSWVFPCCEVRIPFHFPQICIHLSRDQLLHSLNCCSLCHSPLCLHGRFLGSLFNSIDLFFSSRVFVNKLQAILVIHGTQCKVALNSE